MAKFATAWSFETTHGPATRVSLLEHYDPHRSLASKILIYSSPSVLFIMNGMKRIVFSVLAGAAAFILAFWLTSHADAAESSSSGSHAVNAYIEPIALLLGAVDGGVDIQINDRWTVGPSLLFWNSNILGYKIESSGFGGRVAYSFRNAAFVDGPYVASTLNYAKTKVTHDSALYGQTSADVSGAALSGMAGYHWILPSGLTFRAGVGLALSSVHRIEMKDSGGTVRDSYELPMHSAGFATEVHVGWKF